MQIKIEPVKNNEVQILSDIGARCFYDTFHEDNTAENMRLSLQQSFNTDVLGAELRNPNNYFFFARIENEIAGYLKLSNSNPPGEIKESDAVEIARIYAVKDKIGYGVGKSMLEFAFSFAKQHNKKTIWLGVWEHNKRAIDFYYKHGFEKVSEQIFMLGNDAQTDWLMKKPVSFV